jgi:signal transduction histidine kinase
VVPTQSLLKRQLKRFFGNDFCIPAEWDGFVGAVDSAYAQFIVDRELMERSMELSSQELLEANSEIRAIFQAIPDRVFRLDHKGTILSVTAGTGAELVPVKLLGQFIQEGWLNHAGDAFPEVLRRVIEEKSMLSIEFSRGPKGLESFHEVRLVPLLQDQIVAITRDITERRSAEAKREQLHKQLADASRLAGMAEVANNVLHNISNVLNSVNISAGMIGAKLRDSKDRGLGTAVQLLNEHACDLGEFFNRNPKGKALPGYLNKLVAALADEKRGIGAELESLTRSIDHIKDIVATQQSYSGATSLVGPVQIEDLLEDALRINAAAIARQRIRVVKEYATVPRLLLDKHLVLQILTNLIANARQAMEDVPDQLHQITLRTRICGPADGTRLRISVEDNGQGIAPEILARLFTHGFTTRKDGHGFGLHSCVLAAREMQGTITAHSDGLGQGAAFTLELPGNPAERKP